MKTRILTFPFGVMAFNEDNKLVEKVFFSKNPQRAAMELLKSRSGKISDEIASMISLLQKVGYDTFLFENVNIAEDVQRKCGVKAKVFKPSFAETLRARNEQVAVETGFAKDSRELGLWTHNVSIELAKLQIKGAIEKRDLIIAQVIQTIDDLDRTVNLFMGRLREWYGIHFPELDRLVEKHETYARLVLHIGLREDFESEILEKQGVPKQRAENIAKVAKTSMGSDTVEQDLGQIQALSQRVLELYELRKNFEEYMEKIMEEVAPNIKAIAGPLLGARLIAIAGSLKNLAMRPASTIQVLGAEKALFRSLKTGARPPKHGLIFQHILLHDAKRWQRGKIARALAGKLAIAARTDAFGGRYVADTLKMDIEKRIEEIHKKYKEPPKTPKNKTSLERKKQRPKKRDKKRRKNKRARKG